MPSLRKVAREFVIDAYSAISHKGPLRDEARQNEFIDQSWVRNPADARRLNAYAVLAAYEANVARSLLDQHEDEADENREYGDAALIVDQVMSALLGDTQEIVVPGADEYDPDLGAVDEPTDPPADGEDPPEPEPVDPEALAANERAKALLDMQQWLREWADRIHLSLRMTDAEHNAVHLGDAVYLLGWDARRERVVPAVMDPGCYFPVLPDTIDSYEYPEKVHFAWELSGEDFPDGKPRLRRLTYSLEPIRWDLVEGERGELTQVAPADTTEKDGRLWRRYPWAKDDNDLSDRACYMTDATWFLDDKGTRGVDDLDPEKAEYATLGEGDDAELARDFDLGFDFLPIVHVPNTPGRGNHFGQSSLSRVLQILDDLQSADTDAQRASATTGSPIIVIHGTNAPAGADPNQTRAYDAERRGTIRDGKVGLAPGSAWFMGESGGATVLDTSAQLQELRNLVESLRDRLQVNSRLPAAVLGTMDPSQAPSGYAIQLTFGPMDSMVRTMRLTRSVKYPLMLRMVQRIAQANGNLEEGPSVDAEVRFGSYLPSDMAGTLEVVVKAHQAKLISTETAIGMLVEVGFAVEDIADEIERIESRDFDGANALADAGGTAAEVREYLHLPAVDVQQKQPVPPVPVPVPTPTPPTSS